MRLFRIGGFGGGGNGEVKHASELDQLKIQVYAMGGDQNEVFNSVKAGPGSLDNFIDKLQNGNDFTLAKPLSYSVRSVSTAKLVKNDVYFKYSVKNCRPLNVPISVNPDFINFGRWVWGDNTPARTATFTIKNENLADGDALIKIQARQITFALTGQTYPVATFEPSELTLKHRGREGN